jgi:hypothetical protein
MPKHPDPDFRKSIISVGGSKGGRGFVIKTRARRLGKPVIETPTRRLVITAAHCLPRTPVAHPWANDDRTWKLLAPFGEEPAITAECLFVDPVADIAVLGSPDNESMYKEAEAYDELTESAKALPVGILKRELSAELPGWLLSLAGDWFRCTVQYNDKLWMGGLWTKTNGKIEGGMSGSPILADNGAAIGVLSCSGGVDQTEGGPHARLGAHLPRWLLESAVRKATPSRITAQRRKVIAKF